MSKEDHSQQPYVSIVIDRQVTVGQKEAFEEALKEIIEASRKFPGYLGTDVHFPQNANDHYYRVVLRFQSMQDFKTWEISEARNNCLEKINGLLEQPTKLHVISGLETWFALPRAQTVVPPARHKMAVVTWLAITPLLIVINLLTQPFIGHLPMIPRVLILTPIVVLLMTYAVMPFMAKRFAKWLYPAQSLVNKGSKQDKG